jgi:hypothetical protein
MLRFYKYYTFDNYIGEKVAFLVQNSASLANIGSWHWFLREAPFFSQKMGKNRS